MVLARVKSLMVLMIVIACCLACGEDPVMEEEMEVERETPQEWLDELNELVALFIQEGESRGVSLNANNLTLKFVDEFSASNATEQTCGWGWWNFENTGQRRIELRDNDHCWHTRTDLEKENFMFHELGHALLSLNHTSGRFDNGSGKSIMCTFSDNNNCSNYRVFHQTKEMRDYYLDQLFDSSTSAPAWTRNPDNLGLILTDTIVSGDSEWYDSAFSRRDDDVKSSFTHTFTSDSSSNDKLKIETTFDTQGESIGLYTKSVILDDLQECQALKLTSEYTVTENLTGKIQIYIGLHFMDDNGDFDRIKIHQQEYTIIESEGSIEAEIYCVPRETYFASIYLGLQPSSEGSITFDNVELSRWD